MTNFVKKILKLLKPKPLEFPIFTKEILMDTNYSIGDYTYGTPNILNWGEGSTLIIGKFCSIADGVTILLGGNHRIDWITTYPFNKCNSYFPNATTIHGHPSTKGDVVIGNDVWIGKGVTILSGITIGNGAVIAAEAVVTKDVKPYEMVGGNPAKSIKFRFSQDAIEHLLKIKWWDWNHEIINKKVKHLCDSDIEQFIKENSI